MTDIAQVDYDVIIANRAKGGSPAGTNDMRKKGYELDSFDIKNT